MKTLISPLQTLRLAFGDGDTLPPETIAETDIAAAEARWIVPAIGRDLHEKLLRGAYPDFCADYLAAPTALYTRALVQSRLDVRTDRAGTAVPKSGDAQPADEKMRRRLRRQLLSEARTLLTRATDYLAGRTALIPEYRPEADIASRCSVGGGIVLTGRRKSDF